MEIKDLLGLSKPIEKLIDVLARGVGAVTKPMLIRNEAEAKAYEIQCISKAVQGAPVEKLQYKNGVIIIEDKKGKSQIADLPNEKRAELRILHEESRKQKNIESVAAGAAELLSDCHALNNDREVEQDWINEYFDKVKLVSSSEMQLIWSKILAGEVQNPGTYSIRTMNVLKEMSKDEANLFSRFAEIRLDQPIKNDCFVYKDLKDDFLVELLGMTYEKVKLLESIGLIYTDLGLTLKFGPSERPMNVAFEHGKLLVSFECEANAKVKSLPIIGFTKVGYELSRMVEVKENMVLVKAMKEFMQTEGVKVKTFDILQREGNGRYRVSEEREI